MTDEVPNLVAPGSRHYEITYLHERNGQILREFTVNRVQSAVFNTGVRVLSAKHRYTKVTQIYSVDINVCKCKH